MPTFIPVNTRAEAREAASNYLKNKPNLKGGNFYELPDGTKIRVRVKEGGRLSAEAYDTKTNADIKRAKGESTYSTDAAKRHAAKIRKQAREQSQSTLHQHAYGNRQSIAEHAQDIVSGGIGDDQDSVSEPPFKDFKDTVASKIRAQYGDKYVVDINEVTGYLRIIPREYYNKEQYRSQQPGFDLEPDMDINQVVQGLPFIVAENLGISQTKFPTKAPTTLTKTPAQTPYQAPALTIFPGNQLRLPPMHTGHVVEQPNVQTVMSYENGNDHEELDDGTKGNGNGDNGNGFVQDLVDMTNNYQPDFKNLNDIVQTAAGAYRFGKGVVDIGAAVFGGTSLGLR